MPVEIPYFVGKLHLVVHVYDAQSNAYAGSADLRVANLSNDGGGGSGFKCQLPNEFYPVHDLATNKHYRRNGCTGVKEYNPNGT